MFISQAIPLIMTAMDAHQPVMLMGSTGIGKSDLGHQLAKMRKVDLIDIRLAQYESVDLRGCPDIQNKRTVWNIPEIMPTKGKGIFFIDELNQADQYVQAAAYQLILDRRLGNYELPVGWEILAAGNRLTDQAIVQPMGTALKNRFGHITIETDHASWHAWAVPNGIHQFITGFLRFKPILLNQLDESTYKPHEIKATQNENAFATPRTWAKLSNLLNIDDSKHRVFDYAMMMVGKGAATEFQSYVNMTANLPAIEDILNGSVRRPDFDAPGLLISICAGLSQQASKSNFAAATQYVSHMDPEYQSMFMRDMILRDEGFDATSTFTQWAVKNTAFNL